MRRVDSPFLPHPVGMSSDEHQQNFLLNCCLSLMGSITGQITAAQILYDRANAEAASMSGDERELRLAWMFMAARDSAMRVFDLDDAMHGANAALSKHPTLASLCNRTKLGEAFSLLHSYFPQRGGVRNSAGHLAAQVKNAEAMEKHSVGAVISDSLTGNRYTATFNGKIVEHEMSDATVDHVIEVVTTFFSAFPDDPRRSVVRLLQTQLPTA